MPEIPNYGVDYTSLNEVTKKIKEENKANGEKVDANEENIKKTNSVLSDIASELKNIGALYAKMQSDQTAIFKKIINGNQSKFETPANDPSVAPWYPKNTTVPWEPKNAALFRSLTDEIVKMRSDFIVESEKNTKNLIEFFKDRHRIIDLKSDENRREEKKDNKKSKKSSFDFFDPIVEGKDVKSFFKKFISSAILGPKGLALFSSLIPSKFDSKFGLGVMRTLAGVLIGPEFISAIQKSISADGDITSKIGVFFDELFGPEKKLLESMGIGALTGLIVLGPAGIIIGGMLAGVYNAMTSYLKSSNMSEDDKKAIVQKIKDFAFGDTGIMVTGALAGFKMFGIPGLIIGSGVSAAGILLNNFLENFKNSDATTDSEKIKEAALKMFKEKPAIAGLLAGGTVGGIIGSIGGPIGAVAGVIIGAGVGAISGILVNSVLKKQEASEGSLPLKDAIFLTLKENTALASILAGAGMGTIIGAYGGGPLGAIAGAIVGTGVGLIAEPFVSKVLNTKEAANGDLLGAVDKVMRENETIRRLVTGGVTGSIVGAMIGGPVGLIGGLIVGAGVGYMVDVVTKDIMAKAKVNQKGGSKTPVRDAILQTINENNEIAKWGATTIGTAVGLAVGGPVGAIAGGFLGWAFGKISTIVANIFADQKKNPDKSIMSSIANEIMKTPVSGLAAIGAGIGATAGIVGGPMGIMIGMVIGGVIGYATGKIVEYLEDIGVGDYLRSLVKKMKKSVQYALEGEFEKSYDVMTGKLAVTTQDLEKLIENNQFADAVRSLALTSEKIDEEVENEIEDMFDRANDVKGSLQTWIDENSLVQSYDEALSKKNLTPESYSPIQFLKDTGRYVKDGPAPLREINQLNKYVNLKEKIDKSSDELYSYLIKTLKELGASTTVTPEMLRNDKDLQKNLIQQIVNTRIDNNKTETKSSDLSITTSQQNSSSYERLVSERGIKEPTVNIVTVRRENDDIKRSVAMTPIYAPTPNPTFIDNKNVTLQEIHNVTEQLPMPYLQFALKDSY